MNKWIAYAAYRCEVAGFATDTLDIQCRYFEFTNEADIEPALRDEPAHTYQNEAGETVAWLFVKCLIVWDFDRPPQHGEQFGGVHVNAHEIKQLCLPPIQQAPENLDQCELHQKLCGDDIRICSQSLNEVCHGAYALPDWEFSTLMGCAKSEAQTLLQRLDYLGHRAYQNRQLTHEHVFVLYHQHHLGENRDDSKLLGVYSTHADAQNQIDSHFKHQPGFNQPDGEFSIDCYEIGKSHWLEGFATIEPLSEAMIALIPISKLDTEKADAIVTMGYPAIAPILSDIFHWTQDINWPVAKILQPFLIRMGAPLAPHIKSVLHGHDDAWKYDLLTHYIAHSAELIALCMPELKQFAAAPTPGEHQQEVDVVARAILEKIPC